MILAIIVAEVAFWAFIFFGLTVRYIFGYRRLGGMLLACTPIIDLALLIFIVLDLRSGAEAHWTHGLGAVYLGFTIVYGRRMVLWADRRFVTRRSGVPRKRAPRLYGRDKVRHEWKATFRWWVACVLSTLILWLCVAIVQNDVESQVFYGWMTRLALAAAIATIIPISYVIWPKVAPLEVSSGRSTPSGEETR